MDKLTLSAQRPALEVTRGGEVFRWEYDVVTVKLECDRLEKLYKLTGGQYLQTPTTEMLADLAAYLITSGLPECSIDLAYRVYMLVGVQFTKMAKGIAAQVADMN